jgi:hypothetical protein
MGEMEIHDGRLNLKILEATSATWTPEFAERFSGKLTFSRRFNRPTGLAADQQVDLEIELTEESTLPCRVGLNELKELGHVAAGAEQAFELELLPGSNKLRLEFEVAAGGLISFPIPPFQKLQLAIAP